MKQLLFVLFTLTLIGCSDNFISQIHKKSILENQIQCMNLIVFPPKQSIRNTLNKLYSFDKNCDLALVVSYKDSITCNSNQNANKKALGMAKSYLRLELKRGKSLYYSYYKDLDANIEDEDLIRGFKTMKSSLDFHSSTTHK